MKRNHHLLHAVFSGHWHIHKGSVEAYLPAVVALMQGDSPEPPAEQSAADRNERFLSIFAQAEATKYIESDYYDYFPVKINNLVVMPVMGAIMQYDYCWEPGTKTIGSWYKKAEADPEVAAIVEVMNSPGGSVFGTHELAQLKQGLTKPIVTFCEGMMCSGGLYIGSASDYLISSSPNNIVGSLGVMTSFADLSKYYENLGISFRDIYSKTSPLKNEAYREAQKGNDKPYTDGLLFQMDSTFMAFVKQQRPNVTERALQGAEFTAQDALTNGLIDAIGTFEDAVAKALELSNSTIQTPQTMSTKTVKMSAFMAHLAGFFGAEVVDDSDEVTEATTEEATEEAQTEETEATSEETTEQEDSQATITQLQAQVQQLQAELKQRKAPGASVTKPVAKSAEPPIVTQKWTEYTD